MSNMTLKNSFAGRRVLVTGHTGFKGAWLALWLRELGASVTGYALPPEENALYQKVGLHSLVDSLYGDVRDAEKLERALQHARPEVVFHLAAQPLVRASYSEPKATFDTNVSGLVNLLEAVRRQPGIRVCQIITTDKVYENLEAGEAYREADRLGGHDPYSASKACAELVAGAYRDSFFPPSRLSSHGISLSTARAGNVIGGGDWSNDRLLPDCARALAAGRTVAIRNAASIRPWQHVLDPLSGYLMLAARQLTAPDSFSEAWNFGPAPDQHFPVSAVVESVIRHWGSGSSVLASEGAAPREAGVLRLDCGKARTRLGWRPLYDLDSGIRETVAWYKAASSPGFDALSFTRRQIAEYTASAEGRAL